MTFRRRRHAAAAEQPPAATFHVASYTVYPSGYDKVERPGKEAWRLTVADAGNGWAIRRGDNCLNVALQWEKERAPELCDASFLRRCRYNEHAALLRARRVIDRLEVWGITFDEFAAQADQTATGGAQDRVPNSASGPGAKRPGRGAALPRAHRDPRKHR